MLMRQPLPELQFTHVLPYGALIHDGGVQFVIFSRSATAMRLLLYDQVNDAEPAEILEFDRETDRWGDVWSLFVPGIGPGQLYHFQADGPHDPSRGMWFDGNARLIDPYARALAGDFLPNPDGVIRPPKCVVVDDYFDWEGDRHVCRDLSETIIYEMHVRGFTQSKTAKVQHPGSYLGVIEKIPYLKELGITAVELMPVHEFPILGTNGMPIDRKNYWGYDPLAFFSPHRGYAVGSEPGSQVVEFKQMVRALHHAGIEVILDVVFNHTCEGNELGPVLSFKGLENHVYYMMANGGSRYKNYSGCGNTVNGNHPVVREMIFNCLRHWVHNYHIDGFRFDLASILSRGQNGEMLPNAPIVEMIAEDPMLADTKIIAEAWDAAGAYQVGSFGAHLRWAEWNGRYRDDIRGFWRGDGHTLGDFATRLCGSSDLYQDAGRAPYSSINFITSHDGYTLNDLVSYRDKHNEANGEGNRDGDNHNISDNYGVEGPTTLPEVEEVRLQQIKNMLTTLMLSQGVPMLVSGDECRRTQRGNNNAYCQDNDVSWFDWSLVETHQGLLRFSKAIIHFRREQPTVRRERFLSPEPTEHAQTPEANWFSAEGGPAAWESGDLALSCLLLAPPPEEDPAGEGRDLLFFINSTGESRDFQLPEAAKGRKWKLFVDTAAHSPRDIYPNLNGEKLPTNGGIRLKYRAMRVYVSSKRSTQ